MNLLKEINKKYIILSILFSFLTGLDTLVIPVIVNSIIDNVQSDNTRGIFYATIYGIVGFIFIQLNLFLWKTYIAKINREFGKIMKQKAMIYSLKQRLSQEETENLLYNDIPTIERQYIEPLLNFIYCIWFSLISLIYVLTLSWQVSLLFIVFSLGPLLLPKLFEKKLQDSNMNWSKANESFLKEVSEFLTGRTTIKHYSRSTYFLERFSEKLTKREHKEYDKGYLSYRVTFIINAFAIITGILPFGLGGYLAIEGYLSIGALIAVFLASDRVLSPLENAINHWNSMKATEPLVDKLKTIIDQAEQGNENLVYTLREKIEVSFEDAEIGYSKPLLYLTKNLPYGKKVLITGPSGIGKSTLFKTIFKDVNLLSGKLTVNNKDIQSLENAYLRHHIGYIPQDIVLFDDSILFNICLGETFCQEQIDKVIDQVGLKKLIQKVGLGYIVGHKGEGLSGGERARVVVARALIRDYSILLVDEFSASLDQETSAKIRDVLLENQATIVEIAHHYSVEDKNRYDEVWDFV